MQVPLYAGDCPRLCSFRRGVDEQGDPALFFVLSHAPGSAEMLIHSLHAIIRVGEYDE